MARGRKKKIDMTIDQQILAAQEDVENLKSQLDVATNKLQELQKIKHDQEMESLAEAIKERGLTVGAAITIIRDADSSELSSDMGCD